MARYKATWQRKKLFADGQLLSYRMREFCDVVLDPAALTTEEGNRFEADLKDFIGDVNTWRTGILEEIAGRLDTAAAAE